MTPILRSRTVPADSFEDMVERAVIRAEDLYDLDGETFFRSRDGRIETASREVGQ